MYFMRKRCLNLICPTLFQERFESNLTPAVQILCYTLCFKIRGKCECNACVNIIKKRLFLGSHDIKTSVKYNLITPSILTTKFMFVSKSVVCVVVHLHM